MIKSIDRYFNIPQIKYDSDKLFKCFLENKAEWAKYGENYLTSLHTQYADRACAPIKDIISQFADQSMIENIKYFKIVANGHIDPHCDKRNVAINIPIKTNMNNYTVFYSFTDKYESPELQVNDTKTQTTAKRFKDARPVDKLVSKGAVCLNTSLPHGVQNNSNEDRIILSISFNRDFDNFEIIQKLFKNNRLVKSSI